jgi:hypothetical protein
VKEREIERETTIAEGKMDDPTVARRLKDSIHLVGTCTDMCLRVERLERYRTEREDDLFEWEKVCLLGGLFCMKTTYLRGAPPLGDGGV